MSTLFQDASLINGDVGGNSDSSTRIVSFTGCSALTPAEHDAQQKVVKVCNENKMLRQNLLESGKVIDVRNFVFFPSFLPYSNTIKIISFWFIPC